ncbi:MAG: AgmX/PglI C-terminal domain-containing protein [Deltaproteobacteria bacterium]|nr:AgmX/PglI C-terminal domain-containing protein [Deltaproteobacteria bacterium]
MNGELRLEGLAIPPCSVQQRFLRFALLMSITLHAAGILTSPYWNTRPAAREELMMVDIADIPAAEMPKIPEIPFTAPPPPSPAEAHPAPKEAGPLPAQPPPPPTREMIREKIATRGLLKVLSPGKAGEAVAGADPFAGIKIPREIRVASREPATSNAYEVSRQDAEPPREKAHGIGNQVASSTRAGRALSSRVFRTDAGLEGEISGGIEDENRDSGVIASTVSQYRSGIKYAYNKELLKNPSLSGKIVVAFVILPNGSVQSAEIRQSSVNWPPLEDAVLKRLQHWKFPKSKGTPVRVVFPFVFHPEM